MEEETPEEKEKLENLEVRLGAKPEDMSPYHHITPGIAPAIIFHGTQDKTVPFKSVEAFTMKMKNAGNTCILAAYENEGHGFFNYGKKDNGVFVSTVLMMDKFFVKLGWLKALPEPLKL
jgi:dipeptidyl aminopeptidase/acylaminoacyl peptidase